MKIQLSTLLLLVTSIALAIGWLYERRSYEVFFLNRLEKQLFAMRDIDSELVGAHKVNAFAMMTSAMELGFMSKERFEELRTNRLLDNLINLYRVDQIMRKTDFEFTGAEEFVTNRSDELRFVAGESLNYLNVKSIRQLDAKLQPVKDFVEMEILDKDGRCIKPLSEFILESLDRFSDIASKDE